MNRKRKQAQATAADNQHETAQAARLETAQTARRETGAGGAVTPDPQHFRSLLAEGSKIEANNTPPASIYNLRKEVDWGNSLLAQGAPDYVKPDPGAEAENTRAGTARQPPLEQRGGANQTAQAGSSGGVMGNQSGQSGQQQPGSQADDSEILGIVKLGARRPEKTHSFDSIKDRKSEKQSYETLVEQVRQAPQKLEKYKQQAEAYEASATGWAAYQKGFKQAQWTALLMPISSAL